ncbi:MAG TPA: mevalonate kinase [Phototrophicaceae bacterium]|nr:mevalonate kinase [Phototrophicaceae bacterium]
MHLEFLFNNPPIAEANAPAKIILCGEHAVVYGQPAIAVPVSALRVTVRAYANSPGISGLRLVFGEPITQITLADISESPPDNDPLALPLWLTLRHLAQKPPNVTLVLQSQIPIASGLGSGAAVATALARAVVAALGQALEQAALNKIVYEVEKVHHGTPSGIDNTVIVYEQPVYFVRHQPIETFHIGAPLTFLIGDTGQSASTRVAVGDVRRLFEAEPERIQPILDAIGDLVVLARKAIERGDSEELGRLMVRNHGYLRQLTVSSPELDTLVKAALDAGALGAKLSGGGRGGNMIALVTPDTQNPVRAALAAAGARRVFETTLG